MQLLIGKHINFYIIVHIFVIDDIIIYTHLTGKQRVLILSTCPIKVGLNPTDFLHHNQIFDVISEKCDCDVKHLIMMQKARGLLAHFDWTRGQENCKIMLLSNNNRLFQTRLMDSPLRALPIQLLIFLY